MDKLVDSAALLASDTLTAYIEAGGEYHSTENQRILSRLVEREVLHCISSTVTYVLQVSAETKSDYVDYDDVLSLLSSHDWESPADSHIDDMDRDELIEWLEAGDYIEQSRDDEEFPDKYSETDDELRSKVRDFASNDYEEFCRENDIDPEDTEAYEHWAVTTWLKNRLAEMGEITGDLLDFDVWGRCTTGQAISMDGVIASIAAGMQILDGQKNSWKE